MEAADTLIGQLQRDLELQKQAWDKDVQQMTNARQELTTTQAILAVCFTVLFALAVWRALTTGRELTRNGICISEPSRYDICRVAASNGVAFVFGASFIGRNHYQDAYQVLVQLVTDDFEEYAKSYPVWSILIPLVCAPLMDHQDIKHGGEWVLLHSFWFYAGIYACACDSQPTA